VGRHNLHVPISLCIGGATLALVGHSCLNSIVLLFFIALKNRFLPIYTRVVGVSLASSGSLVRITGLPSHDRGMMRG